MFRFPGLGAEKFGRHKIIGGTGILPALPAKEIMAGPETRPTNFSGQELMSHRLTIIL